MNLLLLFHDPDFMPLFVLMMFVGVPLVLFIVVRALYIIILRPTKLMLRLAGGILGVCLAVWPVAYWSSSMLLEVIMMLTTYPFGVVLGFLHGDLWYFLPRDAVLGGLNSAHHPITPHIFVERTILNAAAIVWVLDWIQRRWPDLQDKVKNSDTSRGRGEFGEPTLL